MSRLFRLTSPWHHAGTAAIIVLTLSLIACAGTKSTLSTLAATPLAKGAPTKLMVSISDTHVSDPEHKIANALQARLISDLQAAGGNAAAAPASANSLPEIPNTLLIRCGLVQLTPGNEALRLGIGFGTGQTKLAVNMELIDLRATKPVELVSLQTTSTTGALPGPALALLPAISSGQITGMVLGSAGLWTGSTQTLTHEVTQSSADISTALAKVFQSRGWDMLLPPAPSELAATMSPVRP
jgi:hypothetical protein